MLVSEARAILGVGVDDDLAVVRAAYRQLLLTTHPDVSSEADAAAQTMRLTAAYTTLLDPPVASSPTARTHRSAGTSRPGRPRQSSPPRQDPEASPRQAPTPADEPDHEPIGVALVDSDTIAVGAPASEALMYLIDAAHRLGEITYLDPSAGMIEMVVEFIDAPTSSVLMTMQGRATGVTDIFVSVEPLSGGETPPSDAVTRLLLRTLVGDTG